MSITRREFLRDSGAAVGALSAAGSLGIAGALAEAAAPRKLSAHALGYTSLKTETRLPDLPLEGRMPEWLTGTLLRNGPALFEVGPDRFNHWFDGLAMLHAFSFERGRVAYANRFLRSSAYRAWKRQGRIVYSEFATDPCRKIFSGVSTVPVLGKVPNANVSIERLGNHFRALTEIPVPVRFDRKNLRTIGIDEDLPLGTLGTAHPHHDPATGERFSYEIELVPPSGLRLVVTRNGRRKELAFIPESSPGYLHTFGLTERFLVVYQQPWRFNLAKFLSPDRGPIVTNFEWHGSEPSRITLIDRAGGGVVGAFEVDPLFVFHQVNAYERNGKLVLDVCAYEDDAIIGATYLKQARHGDRAKIPRARLLRYEVSLSAKRVSMRRLIGANMELPRIDYDGSNGRRYRYAYGVGLKQQQSGFVDQIVKADVRHGEARTWSERGCFPGEPVFVPRPGRRSEDDGVILTVVLDGGRRASSLVVLDARSMQEIARASVPHHIPFGFHGIYAD